MDLNQIVTYVGVAALIGYALRIISAIMGRFAYAKTGRALPSYGAWAVVTGATEGIGKAMAKQLAKKGMKVCLVGRNPTKLADTKAELEGANAKTVKTIQIDLSTASPDDYARVAKEFALLDGDGGLGVLVNNAGLSYDHPDYLQDVPISHLRNLIAVNCQAVVELSHIAVPLMAKRKKGAILNMSSVSGVLPPNGLLTVYSASKTFVNYFSKALAQECAPKGINVQCCVPGFVATSMSKMRPSLNCPTPDAFVRSALAKLAGGQPFEIPYWSHNVMMTLAGLAPTHFLEQQLLNFHAGIRKRALRKKERLAKEAGKGK